MLDCVLIVKDAPARAVAPRDGESWPRRPALECLLARARRAALPEGGWRRWLLAQHGASTPPDAALGGLGGMAATAAAGLGLPPGEYWLATPVHLVAGLDTVRLHPAGLLALDESHGQQLAADFARVFAGSGWQLHATGGRDLLLSAPAALWAASDDPVDWLGDDPRAGLPRGPGAGALRTLATELEMWLHEHPVNRARESARQLPVSGLWLWGGGSGISGGSGSLVARRSTGRLFGEDLVAQALWTGSGQAVAPLPANWAEAREATAAANVGAGDDTCHLLVDFESLEPHWLVPLLADWRRGNVRRIRLVAGRHLHELTPAARWRFWSRSAPWWERLGP